MTRRLIAAFGSATLALSGCVATDPGVAAPEPLAEEGEYEGEAPACPVPACEGVTAQEKESFIDPMVDAIRGGCWMAATPAEDALGHMTFAIRECASAWLKKFRDEGNPCCVRDLIAQLRMSADAEVRTRALIPGLDWRLPRIRDTSTIVMPVPTLCGDPASASVSFAADNVTSCTATFVGRSCASTPVVLDVPIDSKSFSAEIPMCRSVGKIEGDILNPIEFQVDVPNVSHDDYVVQVSCAGACGEHADYQELVEVRRPPASCYEQQQGPCIGGANTDIPSTPE